MIQNRNEIYQKAYNELINNLSEINKIEYNKNPIDNFNYVFGNECFTCFNKATVEKIIKILNEMEIEHEI